MSITERKLTLYNEKGVFLPCLSQCKTYEMLLMENKWTNLLKWQMWRFYLIKYNFSILKFRNYIFGSVVLGYDLIKSLAKLTNIVCLT